MTNNNAQNEKDWKEMNAVEKRDSVAVLLENNSQLISRALPKHLSIDRLIGIALTSISKTPKLLKCTRSSLLGSIIQAGKLGLNPDGVLGEAYLIPYFNKKKGVHECQFMTGYRGLISLAYRSNQVASIEARVVYEKDRFEYEYGLNSKLVHVPATGEHGELTHAYCVVKFQSGGSVFEVMTRDEIELIRLISKNKDGEIWEKYYPEMAKKTVIRKTSKICPLSVDFQTAVGLEEQVVMLDRSQNNDTNLLDLGNGLKAEAQNNMIENAEIISQEESTLQQEHVINKGTEALKNTIDQAKKNNGNGNKSAATKTPVEEAKDRVDFYTHFLKEATEKKDTKLIKEIGDKLKDAKDEYEKLSGKESK
jgi:recombination protein RecT